MQQLQQQKKVKRRARGEVPREHHGIPDLPLMSLALRFFAFKIAIVSVFFAGKYVKLTSSSPSFILTGGYSGFQYVGFAVKSTYKNVKKWVFIYSFQYSDHKIANMPNLPLDLSAVVVKRTLQNFLTRVANK